MALPSALQTVSFFANGVDFTGATGANPVIIRPSYASGWRIESVFYRKVDVTAVTLTLSILSEGILYTMDTFSVVAAQYIFPNARVPYPIALGNKSSLVVTTSAIPACPHSIVVNWSQF